MEEKISNPASNKSPLGWIAFVIVILVLGAASYTAIQNNPDNINQNNSSGPQPTITKSQSIAPFTFVYGSWTGTGSEITAVDLSSRTIKTIAKLPVNIKKVGVLSPQTLLYINNTDINDHGKNLTIYDIENKKEITTIPADNGFGIDDYILSPNKNFVTTWEISLSEGSNALQGGRSRVYAIDLSDPANKKLLFNENIDETTPINYPRAILNNGKVFTDKFIPNTNFGWAQGMSVVNFDGSNKKDIVSMAKGTYGTQPHLSPKGDALIFAGYDGSTGNGNELIGEIRRALLIPNTVETLNTITLERKELKNLPNTNTYSNVFWGKQEGSIYITLLSDKEGSSGIFTYSLPRSSLEEINLPDSPTKPYSFIGNLDSELSLIGKTDDSRGSLANLGEEYAASLTDIYAHNKSTGDLINIRINESLAQYITLLPANYFQNVLGIAYAQGGGNPKQPNVTVIDFYSDKPSQENLQLKTFLLKPELAPVREKQQSAPVNPPIRIDREKTISCRDLATEQCLAKGHQENTRAFQDCHRNAWDANRATKGTPEAVCNKSPLYVYGAPGQNIEVKIHTSVYNDSPVYKGSYQITIGDDGDMIVNGKTYDAIAYDYRSNLRTIKPPTKGSIVAKADIEKTLKTYADKLGLNEKETTDLISSGKAKITTPYAFISFFDQETSHAILPLVFNPQPDNYHNIVFYFKLLHEKPNYSVSPPKFGGKLNRSGLTAIEISEIVE